MHPHLRASTAAQYSWMGWLPILLLIACHRPKPAVNYSDAAFPLTGITIQELSQRMASGELTAVGITELYLQRIGTVDRTDPALHAVIEINPDALRIAAELDRERAAGHLRGPLHGIPVLLKDNIDTGDRMQTTAGSLALAGHHAQRDAAIVSNLRKAGAIILGKTNMTEWANFRSPHAISGWSSRGGQTKNPYNLTASPCGSSSGSAVAVAADLCAAAAGTSTNGSIACPAAFNGVVGIRPTLGLLSCEGIIPASSSLDAPGTFGRTVRDAALMLYLMAGDETALHLGTDLEKWLDGLDTTDLKGKRIGVERAMLAETQGIGELLKIALDVMRRQGAVIVPVEYVDHYKSTATAELEVMHHELKDGLNRYLANTKGKVQSLEQLIRFNEQHAAKVMPYFGQEYLEQAMQKEGTESPAYLQAKKQITSVRIHLDQLMHDLQLDALAGVGFGAYSPAAVAGYPTVTVPMGLANDLPVGITFVGRPFGEAALLKLAHAYEQLSVNRITPRFHAGDPFL